MATGSSVGVTGSTNFEYTGTSYGATGNTFGETGSTNFENTGTSYGATESTADVTGSTNFENTGTSYGETGSTGGYTDSTYMATGSSTDFDVGATESSTVAMSSTLEESTEASSTVASTGYTDTSTSIEPSVEPLTNQTNKITTENVSTYIPDDIWVKGGATTSIHITQCEAKGKPQPQVTWSKFDDSSNGNPRFSVQNGVLVFLALDSSLDSGLYVCEATNGQTSDSSYMAVYQEKTIDCSNTFKQFSSSVVYRAVCPPQCLSLTPPPAPVKVTKSSPVCSSLQADATGEVAWMLRSFGDILQLTTDQEGQIQVTRL